VSDVALVLKHQVKTSDHRVVDIGRLGWATGGWRQKSTTQVFHLS